MKRTPLLAAILLSISAILTACGDTPPTPTPVPTATTAALPTPTQTAPSQPAFTPSPADYVQLAISSYTTEFGSTNVVGAFRYHGKQTIVSPDITVTATDASGKAAGTDPFLLKTVVVKPDSLVLFQASFSDPLPEGTNISAAVSGGSTEQDLLDALSGDFEASNIQFVASDRYPNGKAATGTLKNVGTTTTTNIQILVAFWGENDQLLDVATGTTTAATLAPNAESDFSVDSPNAAKVIRADVVVSASANK